MSNDNTYKMVIGDWSDDGHGKSNEFVFETNATDDQIREAYLKAVTACRVALHDSDRSLKYGSDKNAYNRPDDTITVLANYENSTIPAEAVRRLTELGVSFDQFENETHEEGETFIDKYGRTHTGAKEIERAKSSCFGGHEVEGTTYPGGKGQSCGPTDTARLFLEMVKTQIEGFTYEFVDTIKPINGYWGDLNTHLGYGCYH